MKLFRVEESKGEKYYSRLVLADNLEMVTEAFPEATGIYLQADTEQSGNNELVVLKGTKKSENKSNGVLDTSIY